MALRESRIGELVERVRQQSSGFAQPEIIVIGGYALRAFVPFARYSRDCDFALRRGRGWSLDRVVAWFPDLIVEAQETAEQYGYLRLVQLLGSGKTRAKIALDFMEGQVRGRTEEAFIIDREFVARSAESQIQIAGKPVRIRVPSYEDYLLLKLLSARPSDVRDLAALIWKNGIPEPASLVARASNVINQPDRIADNIKLVIKEVDDSRFIDSWRGTFITEEFTESNKIEVLSELRRLRAEFASSAADSKQP
jgi:hypothetical protein